MKKSLFLYLFIVSVLMTVFTYMYYSKKVKFEAERFENLKNKMNDTIQTLNNQIFDANYFTLRNNDNAQNYLEDYSIEKLIPKIEASLMELNDNPEGNPLVDFGKIDDRKFIINKIEVLNHRWIIADFSNGELWGEVLLQYFVEEDESLDFKIIQSILYPKQ
ncbi:MAG: hypothetical protein CVU07_05910 [Bacteroidetes bacterium HGW-Bacteroidetes-23]|nr:MAG: hypothetical protein CVU07_05910 [Bacteroidetes bacterium HGW-Bacteroidetes-23]